MDILTKKIQATVFIALRNLIERFIDYSKGNYNTFQVILSEMPRMTTEEWVAETNSYVTTYPSLMGDIRSYVGISLVAGGVENPDTKTLFNSKSMVRFVRNMILRLCENLMSKSLVGFKSDYKTEIRDAVEQALHLTLAGPKVESVVKESQSISKRQSQQLIQSQSELPPPPQIQSQIPKSTKEQTPIDSDSDVRSTSSPIGTSQRSATSRSSVSNQSRSVGQTFYLASKTPTPSGNSLGDSVSKTHTIQTPQVKKPETVMEHASRVVSQHTSRIASQHASKPVSRVPSPKPANDQKDKTDPKGKVEVETKPKQKQESPAGQKPPTKQDTVVEFASRVASRATSRAPSPTNQNQKDNVDASKNKQPTSKLEERASQIASRTTSQVASRVTSQIASKIVSKKASQVPSRTESQNTSRTESRAESPDVETSDVENSDLNSEKPSDNDEEDKVDSQATSHVTSDDEQREEEKDDEDDEKSFAGSQSTSSSPDIIIEEYHGPEGDHDDQVEESDDEN